jgi:predicted small metal-binding protein
MTMVLRCRDTGADCSYEARADDEKELLDMAFKHGREVHNMERTPELEDMARKLIRSE